MLEGLFRFADVVRELAATDRPAAERLADEVAREVANHISARPQTTVNIEDDVKQLVDLLSLPVWGKRHEMYSAWVLTEIVAAFGFDRVRVHVADSVLAFSFAGSHIATVSTVEGPVELWAELRSAYATPVGRGRSAAIQPDYRLSRAPVTAAGSALLAIECKQYRRSVRKNVADALADYTGGLPNAQVLIASHGKVSDAVMDKLTPDQRGRSVAVSGLRPNSGAPNDLFRTSVANALPARQPEPEQLGEISPATPLTITLDWAKAGVDLDLYAWLCWPDGSNQVISFRNPAAPRVWLDDDVQDGSGPECITVTSPVTQLVVWVHAFRDGERIPRSDATVSIRGPQVDVTIPCPGSYPGVLASRLWVVATVGEGTAVEITSELIR